MSNPESAFDHNRYQRLLAEATDETKRLALIDLLIEEKARDRLMRDRIHSLGLTRPVDFARDQDDPSK